MRHGAAVQPSSDTTVLLAAAERGMRKIYQPGYRLVKAGVMLLDLSPQTRDQPSLLPEEAAPAGRDHSALMEAMDRINQRWGKGAVAVGSAVQVGAWGMRHVHHALGSGAGGAVRWISCPSLCPGLKRPSDPPAAIDPQQSYASVLPSIHHF